MDHKVKQKFFFSTLNCTNTYVFQNKKFWLCEKVRKNVENGSENRTWKKHKMTFLLNLSNS